MLGYSLLQCVAVCRGALWCSAVYCGVLQGRCCSGPGAAVSV